MTKIKAIKEIILLFLPLVFTFCFADISPPFSKEGSFVYGNFFDRINGSVLQKNNKLLSQVQVDSETECAQLCATNALCLSVNFGPHPNVTGKVHCELLSFGSTNYQDHLVAKVGFYYMRIKTYCTAKPCLESSVLFCNPLLGNPAKTYACICRNSNDANFGYCISDDDTKCNTLGMEDGTIQNSQITASDQYSSYYSYSGRLNYGGSWAPSSVSTSSWLMVDLSKNATILAVATQGRHDSNEFFQTYILSYRVDEVVAFATYKEGGKEKTLQGITSHADVFKVVLKEPFVARYVRFVPKTWTGSNPGWRVELYGCHH